MSINFQALTLGEGELYLDDQKIGPVTDIRISKQVERFGVESAEKGEFILKHLVPIRRSFSISMVLKEFAAPALSFFFSSQDSSYIASGTSSVTEFTRLYPSAPTILKFIPSASPTIKSVSSGITYAEGVDYSMDLVNRRVSLIPSGSIVPGELLEVSYSYDAPPSRQINLGANPVRTAKVEILHRYPDGQSILSIVLRKVELDASGFISIESDELMGIPISGRCLADDNYPDSPFGYVKVFGEIMSQMNTR